MIKIKHITKSFILPHERKYTIFEHILSFIKMNKGYEKYYALKDITLDIEEGEVIGIIGDNGSGKSTLLKIIAKILVPDNGEVITHGKISSFIELGVGFQDELTARENTYLYGILTGMSKKEISAKYEEIVKYSGVKKFMDVKLKKFSTGMRLRVAFSTAIQSNPDILILDDIIGVGDINFQKKCFEAFQRFKKERKTIILAYHHIEAIEKLCDKVLYLEKGRQVAFGPASKIVKMYVERNAINNSKK